MTPEDALAFVRRHGVVLESAGGPVPSLAREIAGDAFRGSWWSHPRARAIFRATRAVRDADEVLTCRLVDGKISFVHRRLWPALVRLAEQLPPDRLARVREEHTDSGRHVVVETPYPEWVPAEVIAAAAEWEADDARDALGLGA